MSFYSRSSVNLILLLHWTKDYFCSRKKKRKIWENYAEEIGFDNMKILFTKILFFLSLGTSSLLRQCNMNRAVSAFLRSSVRSTQKFGLTMNAISLAVIAHYWLVYGSLSDYVIHFSRKHPCGGGCLIAI